MWTDLDNSVAQCIAANSSATCLWRPGTFIDEHQKPLKAQMNMYLLQIDSHARLIATDPGWLLGWYHGQQLPARWIHDNGADAKFRQALDSRTLAHAGSNFPGNCTCRCRISEHCNSDIACFRNFLCSIHHLHVMTLSACVDKLGSNVGLAVLPFLYTKTQAGLACAQLGRCPSAACEGQTNFRSTCLGQKWR